MGGANTECWHTVNLWRQAGWEVNLVPTWGRYDHWQQRLDQIGCQTHHVQRERLQEVPGLADSIAVGICNSNFISSAKTLRRLGCRLVWVNCMTFMFPDERQAWGESGLADAYVFQSEFQRRELQRLLLEFGYRPEQGFLIRGAFEVAEYPFNPRPHLPQNEFVIGRLARPDLDKWSSNTWPICGATPYAQCKALVMGWNQRLRGKLGNPPPWATWRGTSHRESNGPGRTGSARRTYAYTCDRPRSSRIPARR